MTGVEPLDDDLLAIRLELIFIGMHLAGRTARIVFAE